MRTTTMRGGKQILKSGLILTMAMVLLLCGCAKAEPEEKEPIHINIWSYYTGAQLTTFDELIDRFNRTAGRELGIVVENTSFGDINELADAVMDSARGKVGAEKLPNIFSSYADTAYELDQMGILADISPYMTQEERDSYVEGYLEEGDFYEDNRIKIFPIAKCTEVFLLNKTDWEVFAQATGATYEDFSTLEGLTATAQAYYEWTDSLTQRPNDGKAFFGRDAMDNYFYVGSMQLGQELIQADGEKVYINFSREIAQTLWENYYVPFVKGYFAASGRFRSDDVKTGNVISFIGSSSSATFFPKEVILEDGSSYPIEMDALPCPGFENGESYAVQQGAGMVVVQSGEEKIAASVEFLKWFAQEEQNIKFSVESGYMPVLERANDLEIIRANEPEIQATVAEILDASIATVKENHLYTVQPFKGGDRVRKIIKYSMSDLAEQDRAVIVERIAQGMNLDEACREFLSEEYFEAWYEQMVESLQAIVE